MRGILLILVIVCYASAQQFSNFAKEDGSDSGQECFCLPANQRCDPTQPIPRNSIKISGVVNTRILNSNPESLCSQGRVPCCFDLAPGAGGNDGLPNGDNFAQGQSSCGLQFQIERRAVPGQADFGEYPWMALITGANSEFIGSGVLISSQYVMTVAHRLPSRDQWNNIVVRLGDYDIANEFDRQSYQVEKVPVSEVIIHPRFNKVNLFNDIALLRLQYPVKFSHHLLPACLPEQGQLFVGQRCFVSGWGKNIQGNFQTILKEVDLPVVESGACESILQTTELSQHYRLNKKSFMCAGGEPGKDACEGDGGAPLVCKEPGFDRFVVVGLVAWGQLCGTHVPGVYANVENYVNFIHSYI